MPTCNYCGESCTDFKALAVHIIANKSDHPKSGYYWALKFNTNAKYLNSKQDRPSGRLALSDEDKQAKADCHLELSGELRTVMTHCPTCDMSFMLALPVEYVADPTAWKIGKTLAVSCQKCRK